MCAYNDYCSVAKRINYSIWLNIEQFVFQRFQQIDGVFVTSCETILLQWVGDKQHEQFKPIQNLIKELPPDTGLSVKSSM